MFKSGLIDGVEIKDLVKYVDRRGWLVEIFRQDQLLKQYLPLMGYISMTENDVARGPHAHVDQTDYFCFLGPSNFKIYLWDSRKDSPSYLTKQILYAGEEAPKAVIIPPGVVHAYKNVGGKIGMVVNCPNRLYAGEGKKDPVDEIRYEDDPETIYKLD